MTMTIRTATAALIAGVACVAGVTTLLAQQTPGVISGPVGPSPYDIVRGWHKPNSEPGFTFGGNSGVFAGEMMGASWPSRRTGKRSPRVPQRVLSRNGTWRRANVGPRRAIRWLILSN